MLVNSSYCMWTCVGMVFQLAMRIEIIWSFCIPTAVILLTDASVLCCRPSQPSSLSLVKSTSRASSASFVKVIVISLVLVVERAERFNIFVQKLNIKYGNKRFEQCCKMLRNCSARQIVCQNGWLWRLFAWFWTLPRTSTAWALLPSSFKASSHQQIRLLFCVSRRRSCTSRSSPSTPCFSLSLSTNENLTLWLEVSFWLQNANTGIVILGLLDIGCTILDSVVADHSEKKTKGKIRNYF